MPLSGGVGLAIGMVYLYLDHSYLEAFLASLVPFFSLGLLATEAYLKKIKSLDAPAMYLPHRKEIKINSQDIVPHLFLHELGHHMSRHLYVNNKRNDNLFFKEGIAEWTAIRGAALLADQEKNDDFRLLSLSSSKFHIHSTVRLLKGEGDSILAETQPYNFGYSAMALIERKHGLSGIRQLFRGNYSCFKR